MSELIEILEKMLELLEETDYPIDKFLWSETYTNEYFNHIHINIKVLLEEIKDKNSEFNDYWYRRIIVSSGSIKKNKKTFYYDYQQWEIINLTKYRDETYELILRIKK